MSLTETVAFALDLAVTCAATTQLSEKPKSVQVGGVTGREKEILRLVVEGRSTREIAEELFVSHRTVSTHLTNIFNKLGVSSRSAAAAYAVRHRLV
jgi:DNA-binding NarL/FixJ family response regulator